MFIVFWMVVFLVINYRRWLEIYKLLVGFCYVFYNIWLGEGFYYYYVVNVMFVFLWWRKVNYIVFNWILWIYRYFVYYLFVIWIIVDVLNIILKWIDVILYVRIYVIWII